MEVHGIGICKGCYAPALQKEWESWDEEFGSENDPVNSFPEDQLYVIYIVADGGSDLEKFEPRSFSEACSILLQVCSLSVSRTWNGVQGTDWRNNISYDARISPMLK